MPDYYVPLSDTRFVDYNVGGYHVLAPHFVAERHPRADWETVRTRSMEENLRPGMTLFDVGSEQGYQSAIYARFVNGGENMVLMEPVPQVWVNTRATWEANGLKPPKAVYCGFIGEETWVSEYHDFPVGYRDGWPECAYATDLLDATKFRYYDEHQHCTDSTTIDDFISTTGIIPSAITMDVEGFEPLVIAGSIQALELYQPLLWISVHRSDASHNNILARMGGGDRVKEMYDILHALGYQEKILGEDHEIHQFWYPK